MHACVINMYVCVRACVCVCMGVCNVYVCVCMCMGVWVYGCMGVWVYVCTYVCMCAVRLCITAAAAPLTLLCPLHWCALCRRVYMCLRVCVCLCVCMYVQGMCVCVCMCACVSMYLCAQVRLRLIIAAAPVAARSTGVYVCTRM